MRFLFDEQILRKEIFIFCRRLLQCSKKSSKNWSNDLRLIYLRRAEFSFGNGSVIGVVLLCFDASSHEAKTVDVGVSLCFRQKAAAAEDTLEGTQAQHWQYCLWMMYVHVLFFLVLVLMIVGELACLLVLLLSPQRYFVRVQLVFARLCSCLCTGTWSRL